MSAQALSKHQLRLAEAQAHAAIEARRPLLRRALEDALLDRRRIGRALALKEGVWWDAMAPLTAAERTAVLRELRKIFGLPPEAA
jgi:hypothetical protein